MGDAAIDDWMRLCALIDDDPEVATTVREADDDEGRWEALFDGLDDAGALAYLDWKDGGVELADVLPELPRINRLDIELDEVGDLDDLTAAIARADALLAPHGLRLLHLEEDSDAYPLVAVPAANVAEIIELTARLGRSAKVPGE